jgi:hypothetical protein
MKGTVMNDGTYTESEVTLYLLKMFPEFEYNEDSDGQLIICTGKKLRDDGMIVNMEGN